MHSKYIIGNSQTIGTFAFQSNYFSTRFVKNGEGVLGVLADGTVDCFSARKASIIACDTLSHYFMNNYSPEGEFTFFEEGFKLCKKNIDLLVYTGKIPKVSLLAVFIYNKILRWKLIGDLSLFYYGKRGILLLDSAQLSNSQKTSTKTYEIENGDMVMLCSNGVIDVLSEIEMEDIIKSGQTPYDKSQDILAAVVKKNRGVQRNATNILIQCF